MKKTASKKEAVFFLYNKFSTGYVTISRPDERIVSAS